MLYLLFSTVVGVAYPIWASFKALETADKEDDYHWYDDEPFDDYHSCNDFFQQVMLLGYLCYFQCY
jgi:hypothetical protein